MCDCRHDVNYSRGGASGWICFSFLLTVSIPSWLPKCWLPGAKVCTITTSVTRVCSLCKMNCTGGTEIISVHHVSVYCSIGSCFGNIDCCLVMLRTVKFSKRPVRLHTTFTVFRRQSPETSGFLLPKCWVIETGFFWQPIAMIIPPSAGKRMFSSRFFWFVLYKVRWQ